jgi:GTP cyclohydrolase I
VNREKMEYGIEIFLEGLIGPNWREDPNFFDTPARVSKAYIEMLTPSLNNWKIFPAKSSDMVVLRGHIVFGICPHHLFPVEMKAYVGYIPNKHTIGVSKLARAVESTLHVPALQEDLTHAVSAALEKHLEPKGCAVTITGIHGCMRCRGVRSTGDIVTSVMTGVFLLNPNAKAEFLQIIGTP